MEKFILSIFQNKKSIAKNFDVNKSKFFAIELWSNILNIITKKIGTFFKVLKKDGFSGIKKIIQFKVLRRHNLNVSWKMRRAWNARKNGQISPVAFGMSLRAYRRQKDKKFSKIIKFSILVPLYNTPKDFLQEMIGSVLFQSYSNWELCLADGSDGEHFYVQALCEEFAQEDSRIKYKRLEKNCGISENTNECLDMATGDYISLFDHDDLLHPSALYETMKQICNDGAELVYTDEAIFKSPNLHDITFMYLKPDFSQTLLETTNYFCHLLSFKKDLVPEMRFDSNCDGAQDFDVVLRLTEKTKKISHIQKCLYYWRASPVSTAASSNSKPYTTEAGKRALERHFRRIGEGAEVKQTNVPNTYQIFYADKSKKSESAKNAVCKRFERVF